ncbi:hypothetical protein LTS02_017289 [Friedmanniomyces endolithicus]|nr:hypothetical protein LTS02_017289 [Friedmanniomyces endolithicus]KAK0862096.1 hypothetical protein LTR87_016710 [Friedmanniomyces endolithicus]
MNVSNESESELTRIRDEIDSLKRVASLALVSSRDGHAGIADSAKMSEMSLDSYVGRADPMEVDTEAAMENSEKESTKGRKTSHVLSDGSARGAVTMAAKPPIQEHCGGETSPGCYAVADSTLKSERRSGQSPPPENPFSRNHDADVLQSPSMSRRMQHDISDDASGDSNDARSGSLRPGWGGDPVLATTESDPSVTTVEASKCTSPEFPESSSSCEHASSVKVLGTKDDPSDDIATDLVEGISTASVPSSPEAATA